MLGNVNAKSIGGRVRVDHEVGYHLCSKSLQLKANAQDVTQFMWLIPPFYIKNGFEFLLASYNIMVDSCRDSGEKESDVIVR